MIVHRIAAFTSGAHGGNPAGVALCEELPDAGTMQAVAAEVGYSETAFAAPAENGWRVRYFAPEVEVDFCGHATIALGAALAQREGSGTFSLELNRAEITVDGYQSAAGWGASFRSPPTHSRNAPAALVAYVLALFGLTHGDLDERIPPAMANAGPDYFILALRDRSVLSAMRYELEQGRDLARREGIMTFNLLYAETPELFHARNPFPIGGVYEDPATGAAAAALGGYLRDLAWPHPGPIAIQQGEDMGVPCRLQVDIVGQPGAPVRVSGSVRAIHEAATAP
ncbi:PhzF family phenazine biosynthesis protein [Bradyrhizobium sp.]|uniref:PhzF family phenazine biosynthesis protein n=1 Tax=Bradyrhizobium sp. TaxID=376 RepID=UPI0025BC2EE2|nr:PhzF family phenazine biosynthesis protein [Bradyrhizobium sp.]MBV8923611.1 PhzF family phenazine biosynthesis protein [Bradyrhizobium sp.]